MAAETERPSEQLDGHQQRERKSHYWFRPENCNFNPTLPDMRGTDAVHDYILMGWLPDRPFIDPTTRITAFGSCFAANISNYLNSRQYNLLTKQGVEAYIVDVGEGLVNTFAIRQQFEWAFENIQPEGELWYGYQAQHFAYDENIRRNTLDIFNKTDVFILTFGLSEIWYDEPTGAVFWRAVPEDKIDLARHKFRVSTVAENRDNIRAIYGLIRKHRPDAKVIFTLSPIPLIATFRPISCLTANTVSKAILRAAIDEVYREVAHEGRLFYWPSYEIVMEGFGVSPYGGHYKEDRRHANEAMLNYIMRLFEEYYCLGSKPPRSVLDAYVAAKEDALELPERIRETVGRSDRRAIQYLIDYYERIDDRPTASLIADYAAEQLGSIPPAPPADWTVAGLNWQILPSLELVGPAPQIVAVPAKAWNYAASSQAVRAQDGLDLLVRVRVEVLGGVVGVMLIRPDGSALSDRDQCLTAEDGPATVELRVYPDDGPAHILLRNYDAEGVEGLVRVDEVSILSTAPAVPAVSVRG